MSYGFIGFCVFLIVYGIFFNIKERDLTYLIFPVGAGFVFILIEITKYFIGGMLGDTAMVFTILALIVIYYTIYIYLLVLIETIFNIKLNKSE